LKFTDTEFSVIAGVRIFVFLEVVDSDELRRKNRGRQKQVPPVFCFGILNDERGLK